MISNGWKIIWNCGTPKSNSAWNVESPSRNAPGSETRRIQRAHGSSPRRPASRDAAPASTSSTASPTSVIAAPPISIRCVGPHSVTSWPKSRCQTSSSGKPISENAPHSAISTPPSGAYQSLVIRTATGLGFSSGRHIERKPDANTPNRPARMK